MEINILENQTEEIIPENNLLEILKENKILNIKCFKWLHKYNKKKSSIYRLRRQQFRNAFPPCTLGNLNNFKFIIIQIRKKRERYSFFFSSRRFFVAVVEIILRFGETNLMKRERERKKKLITTTKHFYCSLDYLFACEALTQRLYINFIKFI